jgi:hypothetical protein
VDIEADEQTSVMKCVSEFMQLFIVNVPAASRGTFIYTMHKKDLDIKKKDGNKLGNSL